MVGPDLAHLATTVSVWALPVLLAITLHEVAHGFAALAFGDDTASKQGRLSLNPLHHIDPVGTVLVPILLLVTANMLFGWAKPVPVNLNRVNPLRLGTVLVSFAGPATNLVLALISALLIHVAVHLPPWLGEWFGQNLLNSVQFNLILFVFNMIPLPPLDGGNILIGLLPNRLAAPLIRFEKKGQLILLAALFLVPLVGQALGRDFNIFGTVIGLPVRYLSLHLFHLVGLG